MADEKGFKIVYFRDRAKDLGCENVYELMDPSKPNAGENSYIVNDLAVWHYIIKNQAK
jgi:hypothetical protein